MFNKVSSTAILYMFNTVSSTAFLYMVSTISSTAVLYIFIITLLMFVLAGWSVSSFYLISVTAQNRAHDHMNFFAVEGNLQLRFSVNVCCAVLDDQLIGPFILEGRLTGKAYLRFLQEELPRLLEDVSLNKQGRMYFRHDGAPPHSSREVINFLTYRFPG